MFNMIKLEWLGMKCYWLYGIIIPPVLLLFGWLNLAYIIPLTAIYMFSYSVNPFAVEDKGKLDHLYQTLPVSRQTIVSARFSLSLIMQLSGLVFATFTTIIIAKLTYGRPIFNHTQYFEVKFDTVFLLICAGLLVYSIGILSTFPTLFKFGYSKGKILGFILPFIGALMAFYVVWISSYYIAAFQNWLISILDFLINNAAISALFILIMASLILWFSYFLSQRVYRKREF